MGFDVTYHVISEKELKRYVFDVVLDPSIAQKRAKEITDDPVKQNSIIENLYENALIKWFKDRESNGTKIDSSNFANSFSFVIAALSGYLHPFWYSRNGALSLTFQGDGNKKLFTSYSDIQWSPFNDFKASEASLINGNYSASGVLKDVDGFLNYLNKDSEAVKTVLDAEQLESLILALEYCKNNKLWFIEASDLVVPISNQCDSDFDNFRAHFKKNINTSIPQRKKLKWWQKF